MADERWRFEVRESFSITGHGRAALGSLTGRAAQRRQFAGLQIGDRSTLVDVAFEYALRRGGDGSAREDPAVVLLGHHDPIPAGAVLWGPLVRDARPPLALGLLGACGAAGLVWSVLGDLSEDGAAGDADHLWRPAPALADNRLLVGCAAAVVLGVVAALVVRASRGGSLRGWRLGQFTVLALAGAWLGLGYAVATAASVGANIGGGLALIATPLVLLGTAVAVAVLEARGRRRLRAPVQPQPGWES